MHLLFASAIVLATLKTGVVVDNIACSSDPSITYAYYLPTTYDASNRYPTIFVFDPRKRGALGAELFRDAAERFGWIVVSSNNTESDTDPQPSVHAIQLTLPEAMRTFSIDRRRTYVAGFSGTAIIAWAVADVAKDIAGVFGSSGRPLPQPNYNVPFAWYGTAGLRDFNYIETFEIDRGMAAANATHRVELFDGEHQWAPKDLVMRGAEWFEILAMRSGTRARDDAFIGQTFDKEFAIASAMNDPLDAARHFETIVRTYEGLVDVDSARKRAAETRASKEFAKAQKDEQRAVEFELSSRMRLARVIQQFIDSSEPPLAASLAHDLNIAGLQKQASRNTYEGRAAQRALAATRGQLGFYAAQRVSGQKLTVMQTVAQQMRNP